MTDTDAVLQAAWAGVCAIGACSLLAEAVLAKAAAHPEWLQAHTPEEMQQVIDGHPQ